MIRSGNVDFDIMLKIVDLGIFGYVIVDVCVFNVRWFVKFVNFLLDLNSKFMSGS